MVALRRHGVILVAALSVCLALAGQALTSAMMPGLTARDTAETVADASFAYLTSIRTYLAAVLWNRFDPLTHEFYEGATLLLELSAAPGRKRAGPPCPHCGKPLRTALAKQCFACGADWH